MSYRKEFYLHGDRIFVTKGEETSAYDALASAKGQAYAFACATNGKVTLEEIELRVMVDRPSDATAVNPATVRVG